MCVRQVPRYKICARLLYAHGLTLPSAPPPYVAIDIRPPTTTNTPKA